VERQCWKDGVVSGGALLSNYKQEQAFALWLSKAHPRASERVRELCVSLYHFYLYENVF
jgi:hypothetical protein